MADRTIQNPKADATYKQKAYIGSLVCQVTEQTTMQGASDLIDALNDDKASVQIKVGTKIVAKS